MKKDFSCPICKLPVAKQDDCFPFCSQRCQTIDLARWSDGSYSIPDDSLTNSEHDDPQSIH